MGLVAFSEIRHGKDDGDVVVIPEGEPVKGLPKEVVEELKAVGAVGEEPKASSETQEELAEVTSERDRLADEVEQLRQQLAEAEQAKVDAANKGK
jgi:hypothetical protein